MTAVGVDALNQQPTVNNTAAAKAQPAVLACEAARETDFCCLPGACCGSSCGVGCDDAACHGSCCACALGSGSCSCCACALGCGSCSCCARPLCCGCGCGCERRRPRPEVRGSGRVPPAIKQSMSCRCAGVSAGRRRPQSRVLLTGSPLPATASLITGELSLLRSDMPQRRRRVPSGDRRLLVQSTHRAGLLLRGV